MLPCKKKKRFNFTREHHMAPGSISGVSPTTLPISGVWRLLACYGQQGRAEWIVPGDPFALAQCPGQSLPWAHFLMMQRTWREGVVLWVKRFLSSRGYEIEAGEKWQIFRDNVWTYFSFGCLLVILWIKPVMYLSPFVSQLLFKFSRSPHKLTLSFP